MRGNQFYLDGRLYRFDYSGTGPPWPLDVWDDDLQTWEHIGVPPTAPPASSALQLGASAVLADDWLAVSARGEAVLTAGGEGISCGLVRTFAVPEFVLTSDRDTIGVCQR